MHPSHQAIADHIHARRYTEAERLGTAHVRQYPIDGQGWVLLGEALMMQGYGHAAESLFNRAYLLDPEAKWMPHMKQELNRVPGGAGRPDIEALLQVPKITVTAAIIVKNEERCIERCLNSILGAFDEIIVVDSGSTDRTLSLIRQYPDVKLYQTDWEDSFAALRNEALARTTSDWVFWLDADEWLESEDKEIVRIAAGMFDAMTFIPSLQPCLVNHVNGKEVMEFSVSRIFPTNRGLRYSGRIHEQLATEREGIYTSNVLHKPVRIRLHHDGYEPDIKSLKNKIERNIGLLRKMTEEEPDNPGWWYFLGRETMESGNVEQALGYFDNVVKLGENNPRFGRMAEIHMLMGRAHYSQGRLDAAEQCYRKALTLHPDYPDAHYQLACIAMVQAQKLLGRAMEHARHSAQGFDTYRGLVGANHEIHQWRADALIGDLLVHNGQLYEANGHLRKARDRLSASDDLDRKIAFIAQQQRLLSLKSALSGLQGGR